MLILVGTLPFKDLKLYAGTVGIEDGSLLVGNRRFPINRGTAAMIASCSVVLKRYGLPEPYCVISGDTGRGTGSVHIYKFLCENIAVLGANVVAFHYMMPIVSRHNEVVQSIKMIKRKPVLIADAGFMYVAKMSGFAPFYDIFTPDVGELAFLADSEAPHPFYTRGFIFHMEDRVEELIKLSYENRNAAKVMCIKGKTDYICKDGKILGEVSEPDIPELEAIGGTGDTITGMIAALICKGVLPEEASIIAFRVNRLAGKLAYPTPATQVSEIIDNIPDALEMLCEGNAEISRT